MFPEIKHMAVIYGHFVIKNKILESNGLQVIGGHVRSWPQFYKRKETDITNDQYLEITHFWAKPVLW